MKDITNIFNSNNKHDEIHSKWSLTAQLEVFNEGYFVSGEGINEWISVFYNVDFDGMKDSYEKLIIKDNLMAYVSLNMKISFVLNQHIDQFKNDTQGYGLTCISCDSFDQEEFYCPHPHLLPPQFHHIQWVKDDFLYDETIPFDFEAFELIDSGIEYLNPNHFSIVQLINQL